MACIVQDCTEVSERQNVLSDAPKLQKNIFRSASLFTYKSGPSNAYLSNKLWNHDQICLHFVSKLVSELRCKKNRELKHWEPGTHRIPTLQFPVTDTATASMAFIVSRSMLCFEERYRGGGPGPEKAETLQKFHVCHAAKDFSHDTIRRYQKLHGTSKALNKSIASFMNVRS